MLYEHKAEEQPPAVSPEEHECPVRGSSGEKLKSRDDAGGGAGPWWVATVQVVLAGWCWWRVDVESSNLPTSMSKVSRKSNIKKASALEVEPTSHTCLNVCATRSPYTL